MATVELISVCASGTHVLLRITTGKRVEERLYTLRDLAEARDEFAEVNVVLENLRTSMKLDAVKDASGLQVMLAGGKEFRT